MVRDQFMGDVASTGEHRACHGGSKAHSAWKQKSVCNKGIALKIQRAVDCSAKLAHQLRIPGSNPAT